MTGWWLSLPLWKIWLRQLGSWHSQLDGNIKNVPNHQPDDHFRLGCTVFFPIRCIRQQGWTLVSLSERVKEHRFWWGTFGKMTAGLLFLDVSCWVIFVAKKCDHDAGCYWDGRLCWCWMIWVFPEIGAPAVLIHFNRILHDINPPAIKGYPHWWNIICGKTTTITTGCSGWSLTSHHPCRRETVASPIWNAALHMNQLFLLYPGLTLQSWWWTSSQTEIQIIRNQFQISFQVIQ